MVKEINKNFFLLTTKISLCESVFIIWKCDSTIVKYNFNQIEQLHENQLT